MTTYSQTIGPGGGVNIAAYENADGSGFAAVVFWARNHSSDASIRRNGGALLHTVVIPKGSTIDSAFYWARGDSAGNATMDMTFFMNDVDDANNFSAEADVTSRVRTSASVKWANTSLNSSCGGALIQSPDLKSIFQEIVDRAGWVSGNEMCVILRGDTTGTESFVNDDRTPCAPHPYIVIEFTEPTVGGGGGGPQQQAMMELIAG
ncbi:hypothetical protein LCGC14_0595160 [marine sediment metagenome]|uniref:Uncharacterized protein n=1 Tax=marine sediment metagenome TaxID=412755 RepID=A0A0F9RVZ6_9ZZZZ